MDPVTLAMMAGLGINAVGQFMGAADEQKINAANLNFQIQQYNNMMKLATGNMAHGVNPFAQQMLQFVGQPLAAGHYGNSVAYTGGTPSYVGAQPTTGPYGTGGQQMMSTTQLPTNQSSQAAIQHMAGAQMLPVQQLMQQTQQAQQQMMASKGPPKFQSNGGGGFVDLETGQTVNQDYVTSKGGTIVSGYAPPSSAQVEAARHAYPVQQKPEWVDKYVAMTPAQRAEAQATAPQGSQQQQLLQLLSGGYGGEASPQLLEMVKSPGFWSGTDVSFWAPEDQAAFNAFQNAAPQSPLPNVTEANSRYIINGREYSAPRGSPEAEQLGRGIIPEGMQPTVTPEGQGGGGYGGGVAQPTFQPGAGGAGAGGAGNFNFGYNPSLLGNAPQVNAPFAGMTPQMQASMLGGFNPFQAQQSANPQQLAASQIGGFQPFQAPQLQGAPQLQAPTIAGMQPFQAPQLGTLPQLNAPSLGATPQMNTPLVGAAPQIDFNGIQAQTAQAPGGVNVQQAQTPGAVTPQMVSGVGTSGFNPGQDGLLQMMRRDISAPMDPSINPELQSLGQTFDNSALFSALGTQDQRGLDEQVNQLRGSVGSFGQRFGSGLLKAEADLRGDFLANTGARNAQIQANAFEAGMGRQAQGLGMRIGREQFAAGLPFQNAAMQLQAAQGAAGNALQGSGMDLQAQLANQSAGLQAGQFNAGMQSQTSQFNAGNALTADLAQQGLLGQYGLANVQNNLAAQQANLGAQLQAGQFNAGNQFQQQLANQQAAMQAGQFNIGNVLNQQQFGANQQMQAGQFNLANLLQQQQFGAEQQMQAGLAGQDLMAQIAQANAAAQMQGQQFNIGNFLQQQQFGAGQQQQAGLAGQDLMAQIAQLNQQAQMQAGQFNIGNQLQNSQFNVGQNLQAGLAGQGILAQYGLANQASQNNASQFNAGNQLQNQQFSAQQQLQAMLANQGLAGQYGMANQASMNQAGQFNAQMGLQGAQFGAQRNDIQNQLVMQALGQANAAQQGTNQYNLGLMGLMAGVQVPQAQPSPWPGAIGEIGSMAMMAPMMWDFLKK